MTLILSIALAISVVLAGVAAGVAGSLAAKRGGTRVIVQSNSSSSSQGSNASTLPAYSYHINDFPFQPTSNCTSLGVTYTSRYTSANFKIQCGLDLPSKNLYSVFVYYFTGCIEACAAVARYPGLDQTCYSVAFDTNYDLTPSGQYGNCFLKSSSDITATVANINFTSSAVLVGG